MGAWVAYHSSKTQVHSAIQEKKERKNQTCLRKPWDVLLCVLPLESVRNNMIANGALEEVGHILRSRGCTKVLSPTTSNNNTLKRNAEA